MEDDYIIGAFLHPNYKQLRGATDSQVADCYRTCRHFIEAHQPSIDVIEEDYEPPTKKTKVFMSMLMDKQQKEQETGSDELDKYIRLTLDEKEQYENPMEFWKKLGNRSAFPNLVRLARKYYSIPCSSASVERQFSATGQIITQRRANLDPSTVNDIIFLRSADKQLS